jgi:hypothetical protein
MLQQKSVLIGLSATTVLTLMVFALIHSPNSIAVTGNPGGRYAELVSAKPDDIQSVLKIHRPGELPPYAMKPGDGDGDPGWWVSAWYGRVQVTQADFFKKLPLDPREFSEAKKAVVCQGSAGQTRVVFGTQSREGRIEVAPFMLTITRGKSGSTLPTAHGYTSELDFVRRLQEKLESAKHARDDREVAEQKRYLHEIIEARQKQRPKVEAEFNQLKADFNRNNSFISNDQSTHARDEYRLWESQDRLISYKNELRALAEVANDRPIPNMDNTTQVGSTLTLCFGSGFRGTPDPSWWPKRRVKNTTYPLSRDTIEAVHVNPYFEPLVSQTRGKQDSLTYNETVEQFKRLDQNKIEMKSVRVISDQQGHILERIAIAGTLYRKKN